MPWYVYAIHQDDTCNRQYNKKPITDRAQAEKLHDDMKSGCFPHAIGDFVQKSPCRRGRSTYVALHPSALEIALRLRADQRRGLGWSSASPIRRSSTSSCLGPGIRSVYEARQPWEPLDRSLARAC